MTRRAAIVERLRPTAVRTVRGVARRLGVDIVRVPPKLEAPAGASAPEGWPGALGLALTLPPPLPPGYTVDRLRDWLGTVLVADARPEEMAGYCGQDFLRFVHTYGLAAGATGRCLELGANPYFTTFLLREFTELELTLANYFGPQTGPQITQTVGYADRQTGEPREVELTSDLFNIEDDRFPYEDGRFDVVLFCEILEHLQNDPCRTLREIKRVLAPGGTLILTTPNVARLENAARMVAGANIYDPYSGNGPYGRHNREYTRDELTLLLEYLGFDLEVCFTSDVHANLSAHFADLTPVGAMLQQRRAELGQYHFVKAVSRRPGGTKLPAELYRSYPPEAVEPARA